MQEFGKKNLLGIVFKIYFCKTLITGDFTYSFLALDIK